MTELRGSPGTVTLAETQRLAFEFEQQVLDFARKLPTEHLVPFQRKLALDLLRRTAHKTPVDTGRARSNWQLSVGQPNYGEVGGFEKKSKHDALFETLHGSAKSKAQITAKVMTRGVDAVREIPPYDVVYLTNNLPYIESLEEGHSGQAPLGMLGLSLVEVGSIFSRQT